jgi:hypothetical protein
MSDIIAKILTRALIAAFALISPAAVIIAALLK